MLNIKTIVESNDTASGKAFDVVVQALIFISIITFSMETLPTLEDSTRKVLAIMEMVIVIIFTLEYLVRFYVADRKLGYVLSFYGLIDLAAIIPFYISSGIDLRSLRIFRMLRLYSVDEIIQI